MLTYIICLFLYFLPSLITVCFVPKSKNKLKIFLLNLILGWAIVGWFGALIWFWVELCFDENPYS